MPGQSPVQLVKAVSVSEQKEHMKDADIVILATGYQSVQVPIFDCFGNRLTLVANSHMPLGSNRTARAQVDVNGKCQLMDSKTAAPIAGLFGIGQGYSLATSDPMVQAEMRPGAKADSVGLYIKQVANKILSQILPNTPFNLATPPPQEPKLLV